MHELGIMYNIVERVLEVVKTNELTEVEAIVLTVGAQSGVVPQYLHSCYPAAIDGTILEDTILEVEEVPANGICKNCGETFDVVKNDGKCPKCDCDEFELISGTEFTLKEIRAR